LRQTHEYLTAPVDFEGPELLIGASIGGVWSGTYPVDLSRALRRADEAMYAVKRAGGGWMAATNPEPTQPSVNGRRAGRPGTGNAPEGATP
jgi:predicted signal transduction protein with EAL and GGDEF domain